MALPAPISSKRTTGRASQRNLPYSSSSRPRLITMLSGLTRSHPDQFVAVGGVPFDVMVLGGTNTKSPSSRSTRSLYPSPKRRTPAP